MFLHELRKLLSCSVIALLQPRDSIVYRILVIPAWFSEFTFPRWTQKGVKSGFTSQPLLPNHFYKILIPFSGVNKEEHQGDTWLSDWTRRLVNSYNHCYLILVKWQCFPIFNFKTSLETYRQKWKIKLLESVYNISTAVIPT